MNKTICDKCGKNMSGSYSLNLTNHRFMTGGATQLNVEIRFDYGAHFDAEPKDSADICVECIKKIIASTFEETEEEREANDRASRIVHQMNMMLVRPSGNLSERRVTAKELEAVDMAVEFVAFCQENNFSPTAMFSGVAWNANYVIKKAKKEIEDEVVAEVEKAIRKSFKV